VEERLFIKCFLFHWCWKYSAIPPGKAALKQSNAGAAHSGSDLAHPGWCPTISVAATMDD
jgi:hypothetical protein